MYFEWVDQRNLAVLYDSCCMSHTALLLLQYSTVLCFTDEKHNKLVIAWTVCAV